MNPQLGDLLPSPRILLGPGPSMADPRALRAMATPLLGQFDPEFTVIMGEVMALCRFAFQTDNATTFPVSGTGRAGLEAAVASLIEPGDRVVVGECGNFGLLLVEIAERCGADVVPVRAEWGRVIEPEAIESALQGGRTKLVALIHGETSTGVLQPLQEVVPLVHRYDALLLVDAVVTFGGCEVAVDRWGLDIAVAATQKCLSCPSGLAPLTFNARTASLFEARRHKIQSNYLDLAQLSRYWSTDRFNHHTAPTAMVYGLREALRALQAEGLEPRFVRHRLHSGALRAGIAALGLRLFGQEPWARRLPMLTPVMVPEGIDDFRVRQILLQDFGIEIGAAFGPLLGRVWRIGTMGCSATRQNVLLCLAALEAVLRREGWRAGTGAGVDAALDYYAAADTDDPVGVPEGDRYPAVSSPVAPGSGVSANASPLTRK
jgi:aspartate aminotransferase-like enzyme